MSEAKSYDGNQPVVHVVAPGESLSKIAQQYRLPDWHAIWLYNTKVRKVYLNDNPDVIRIGDRLFIPRRPEGYDRLIKVNSQLKEEIQTTGNEQIETVNKYKGENKKEADKRDFQASLATALGLFAVKGAQVAKAVLTAEAATGPARVAAQYMVDAATKELTNWMVGEGTKWAATGLDKAHESLTGKPTKIGATTHLVLDSGTKALNTLRGFSLKGGKGILDACEIALDVATPSAWANAYIRLETGESWLEVLNPRKTKNLSETTYKEATASVREVVRKSLEILDQKIERIAIERNTVYPPEGSQIGRYINFPPLHINVRLQGGGI